MTRYLIIEPTFNFLGNYLLMESGHVSYPTRVKQKENDNGKIKEIS